MDFLFKLSDNKNVQKELTYKITKERMMRTEK